MRVLGDLNGLKSGASQADVNWSHGRISPFALALRTSHTADGGVLFKTIALSIPGERILTGGNSRGSGAPHRGACSKHTCPVQSWDEGTASRQATRERNLLSADATTHSSITHVGEVPLQHIGASARNARSPSFRPMRDSWAPYGVRSPRTVMKTISMGGSLGTPSGSYRPFLPTGMIKRHE